MIPIAHPNSKKPWLKWRLSFSLIEKKIFESAQYIFRKVYLLCKSLARIRKGKHSFPSYLLKTVVLWIYDAWQKSKMKFTEDDILNMMLEIFRNICKFYKDGNVPRYFIPKLNLLEEYSKEIKKAFVEKLKALANLQSLPFSIC